MSDQTATQEKPETPQDMPAFYAPPAATPLPDTPATKREDHPKYGPQLEFLGTKGNGRFNLKIGPAKAHTLVAYAGALTQYVQFGEVKDTDAEVRPFKGQLILSLPDGSRYGFSFGKKKAETFLTNLEAIQKFADEFPDRKGGLRPDTHGERKATQQADVTYEQVLAYLVALPDADYDKLLAEVARRNPGQTSAK